MMNHRQYRSLRALVLVALSIACLSQALVSSGGGAPMTLEVKSPDFASGGTIPKRFTCEGEDLSPALEWSAPPSGTQSFALIADDPDAPVGTWVHWVVFDLPPTLRSLPQAVPRKDQLADGSRQGQNDFGKTGYGGPCPPPGKAHRYFFKLYALDTKLNLPSSSTKKDVERAMQSHVLAEGEYVGRYSR
jgi:Raf kinase inhibitor-like YbhB/YbcL family protein